MYLSKLMKIYVAVFERKKAFQMTCHIKDIKIKYNR